MLKNIRSIPEGWLTMTWRRAGMFSQIVVSDDCPLSRDAMEDSTSAIS